MSLEVVLAGIILIALTFYVLLGGADFGAGVWSLFASGPRAQAQREAITKAIGPIWEANHVWLILVVTLLFTAFPKAFALLSTMLHIPISLMLIGIVLRGSAFAFRNNDVVPRSDSEAGAQRFWERIFAVSSIFTPIMLGIVIAALASGRIVEPTGSFLDVFVRSWATLFGFAVGGLTLALFAFLAAVYLILETKEPALREDFRRRALWASVVVNVLATMVVFLSKGASPEIRMHLIQNTVGRLTVILTAGCALGAFACLSQRRYRLAFLCTVGEVILILWGWAFGQYPYLVAPEVTIADAAPRQTLQLVLAVLCLGALVLFPSLYYLYRIFKGKWILREFE